MEPFVQGALLGSLACAAFGGAVTLVMRRRYITLQKRTHHAERMAELGALTSGLAHELKNPLSTVQLNLQLLQEDLDPHEEPQRRIIGRLATVQREAGRLKDILDDFLRFGGRMEVVTESVDLNDLLEGLVDFLSPQAQLQKVQLRVQRAGKPVMAEVDPKLIKQAILNLMLNAMQAMGADGGEIMLRLADEPAGISIHVTDTGSGIPEELREQIFQAYYSTKRGGSGLGLAMTRRIVEAHGGKISLMSEMGKGSDFTIFLPKKRGLWPLRRGVEN